MVKSQTLKYSKTKKMIFACYRLAPQGGATPAISSANYNMIKYYTARNGSNQATKICGAAHS
jgi:hypothetical protein